MSHRYTLTCGPPSGTMPDPSAACAAITDYLHRRKPTGQCVGLIVVPDATAAITGTFENRRLRLRLSTESWCGVSRPVMRDLWILSTFPCTTLVVHTGGAKSSADWARASGCTTQV